MATIYTVRSKHLFNHYNRVIRHKDVEFENIMKEIDAIFLNANVGSKNNIDDSLLNASESNDNI